MTIVIILFAFTLSLVTNFVERLINPADDDDKEENETVESFATKQSE